MMAIECIIYTMVVGKEHIHEHNCVMLLERPHSGELGRTPQIASAQH